MGNTGYNLINYLLSNLNGLAFKAERPLTLQGDKSNREKAFMNELEKLGEEEPTINSPHDIYTNQSIKLRKIYTYSFKGGLTVPSPFISLLNLMISSAIRRES